MPTDMDLVPIPLVYGTRIRQAARSMAILRTSTLRQRKRVLTLVPLPLGLQAYVPVHCSVLTLWRPFRSLVSSQPLRFSSFLRPIVLASSVLTARQIADIPCLAKNGSRRVTLGDRKRWMGDRSRTLAPPRGVAWISRLPSASHTGAGWEMNQMLGTHDEVSFFLHVICSMIASSKVTIQFCCNTLYTAYAILRCSYDSIV